MIKSYYDFIYLLPETKINGENTGEMRSIDDSTRSQRKAGNKPVQRRNPTNEVRKCTLTVRKDPLCCGLCGFEISDRSNES